MAKNLLLASTSTVHGSAYLGYIQDEMRSFFLKAKNLIFIPYARPSGISLDDYTAKAAEAFEKIGFSLRGIHQDGDPVSAIEKCDGIFTGGGNTFLLLKTLQEKGLMDPLREKVKSGTPYMGTSAGSNIACKSINTTNDMPIVYPHSFEALGLVPFNINPHYLDPDPSSTHMGETRETRINEFHGVSDIPVAGLREGSALEIHGEDWKILGKDSVRVFLPGKSAQEISDANELKRVLMG